MAPDETTPRGVTARTGSTKARIERAALHLFHEGEIDKATTKRIAKEADLSEGALYRHYQSKDQIWVSMFLSIHHRLGTLVEAAGLCDPDIHKQARALVYAYCETADHDWELFSFHLLTMHRFLPANRGRGPSPVEETEKIIGVAMANKQIAEGNPRLIAAMVLGVVLQTALHKAYGRIDGPLIGYHDELTRGVLAILNPTELPS